MVTMDQQQVLRGQVVRKSAKQSFNQHDINMRPETDG